MSASYEAINQDPEAGLSLSQDADGFAVVGIGASAGGLEALERLFVRWHVSAREAEAAASGR